MANKVHSITIKDLEKLEFKEQLEYINNLIKEEGNLLKASNRLGVKKNMIKNIFKLKNYNYNEETQEFEEDNCTTQGVQDDNKKLSKKDKKKAKKEKLNRSRTNEVQIEKVEIIDETECSTSVALQSQDAQAKMLDLINNYDSIKLMIDTFVSSNKGAINLGGVNCTAQGVQQEVIEVITGIQIDLPEAPNFKTSIRVNEIEWKLFKEFMKENKEFSNGDLISQALKEFRLKHQKSQ